MIIKRHCCAGALPAPPAGGHPSPASPPQRPTPRVAAEPVDSGACGLAALIHDSHCGVSLIERSAGVEVGDGAGHRREDGRAHDCGALGRR